MVILSAGLATLAYWNVQAELQAHRALTLPGLALQSRFERLEEAARKYPYERTLRLAPVIFREFVEQMHRETERATQQQQQRNHDPDRTEPRTR